MSKRRSAKKSQTPAIESQPDNVAPHAVVSHPAPDDHAIAAQRLRTTREAIVSQLTPERRADDITTLLSELRATLNANDKKRLRRALRARGYYISKVETHHYAEVTHDRDNSPRNAS